MTKHRLQLTLTTLALAAALCGNSPSWAQVAGGTSTTQVSITETTQLAMGWSVKKTLLGKTIYNEEGQKVGKVDDLIIAPDRNVSYVIVGAGGFIGIGRHDVAIPVAQIQSKAGKLVMAGATKEMIKAMPEFNYASDTTKRDQFVAGAKADIAKGKSKLTELERQAGTASAEAKAKLDQQIAALQSEIQLAEGKISEMNRAAAVRWKEFEASVSEAVARVRKATDTP